MAAQPVSLNYLWLAQWTSGSTINVVLGSPPTGYALILTASIDGKTITSIKENGATWVKAVSLSTQPRADSEIWYAAGTNAVGTSINVTLSGVPTEGFVAVLMFSNIFLALDKTASASGSTNGTAVRSGTTSTTSVANELWVASLGDYNVFGFLFLSTPANGFTGASFGAGSHLAHELAYKIVSATSTASTSDSTYGSAYGLTESWNGCIATFSPGT